MKNIGKLKLNHLCKAELEKRELGLVTGGQGCGCGCNGSSSTIANSEANWTAGNEYSDGPEKRCAEWGDTEWRDNWG